MSEPSPEPTRFAADSSARGHDPADLKGALRGPRRVVVPVVLGCCPDSPRCLLCNPPPPSTGPAVVAALVANYRAERAGPGDLVAVGFYGGAPPSGALLDAIGGAPFSARVRPDLLTRADAARLAARGADTIELDVWTFEDAALKAIGRKYVGRLVREQVVGLRALGLKVGLVLAPGLPGTDHATAMRDAAIAVDLADFVRLHPVLVFEHAGLREAHLTGRYAPLELGAAITVCRDMMDVLEAGGVVVTRVGQQPGPDGLGKAVAGPRHPSLRELVEARRVLDLLRLRLDASHLGTHIVVRCAPGDETRTRGPRNSNIGTLRAERALASLTVKADPSLPRGQWRVDQVESR